MIEQRLKIRLFSWLCFSILIFAFLFTFALATQILPPSSEFNPSSAPILPLKPETHDAKPDKTKEELLNEAAMLNREAEKMIDFTQATQKRTEAQKLIDQANQLKS